MWLTTVTVWLFSREGVAKSPCKCGSEGGIYICLHSITPTILRKAFSLFTAVQLTAVTYINCLYPMVEVIQ